MKKAVLFICLSVLFISSHAQWSLSGPDTLSKTITKLVVKGNKLFAATMGAGIYVSTDTGRTWQGINNGLIYRTAMTITASGDNLFAGTSGNAYISTDDGAHWQTVDSGFENTSRVIYSMATIGSYVFAGLEGGGVYVTTNNGAKWTAVNNGLGTIFPTSLVADGSTLYVATQYANKGIFRSIDYGATWTSISDTVVTKRGVYALAVSEGRIFAGTAGSGIYISTNGGVNWLPIDTGLNGKHNIWSLLTDGYTTYTGTQASGLFKTINDGANWIAIDSGLPAGAFVSSMVMMGRTLFAGTNTKSIWKLEPPCQAYFTIYKDQTVDHTWFAVDGSTGKGELAYSWEWGDGSPTSGIPYPTHVYPTPGNYNICLTIRDNSDGCLSTYCDSSTYIYKTDAEPVTVNCVSQLPVATGVEEKQNVSFNLYPNPSSNNFIIETTSSSIQQVQVYNASGQLVLSQLISGSKTVFSTGTLPAGVYSVCLKGEKVGVMKKLVVVK